MLEHIQIFIQVTRAGSFSSVAKSNGLAVSSISRHVDALEAALGVRLFQRSSRHLLLTDAGELFLPRALAIVTELEDAKAALLDSQAEPRGLLSVTAPAAFGRRHVMPFVNSFLARYPLIELELNLGDHWVDLSVQRTDLAIRIGTLPDSDLVSTRLAPLIRVACASPAYLEQYGEPATPDAITAHSCLTSVTARPGWWNFPGVNHGKSLLVHGRFRSDDTDALMDAAVAGLGIVHLASWLVYDKVRSGQLRVLFPAAVATAALASHHSPNAIHAVRLRGRSHEAKAQLFIAHLKQAFGDTPYWDGVSAPSGG